MRGLEVLGGVGLDRGHAGEVVVQPRRHRRRRLARGGVARVQPALEPEGADQDQRDRQQRQHRQRGGQGEEHRADQQRGHEHLDQVVGAGVEEALDLVDVLVEQRHQAPAAFARDGVGRQRLQVAVGGVAQLVLQVLRQAAPAQRVQVLEQRLAGPHQHGQRHQQVQLLDRVGDAHARQEAGLLVHHHVHGHADQQLRQHVEDLVEHGKQRAQRGIAAVGAGKTQQAAERMDGGHGAPGQGGRCAKPARILAWD